MGKGVSDSTKQRWLKKGRLLAIEHEHKTGLKTSPRILRASNGECCLAYDVLENGKTKTVLTLQV